MKKTVREVYEDVMGRAKAWSLRSKDTRYGEANRETAKELVAELLSIAAMLENTAAVNPPRQRDSFEKFLEGKFMESDYANGLTKDQCEAGFERYLEDLDPAMMIQYGDEYGRSMIEELNKRSI